MDKLKLCVICCSAFNSASVIASDAARCRDHLVAFCKLLAEAPPKQHPDLAGYLEKSFPGMEEYLIEAGMSVCAECHSQITLALEKASEAEKKEEQVRKLQLQLLQEMKQLKVKYDDFHEELTKVEKAIEMSDVSCLMYHISKAPHSKTRATNDEVSNGIVLIRDRIGNVMTELRNFQAQQETLTNPKFEPDPATDPEFLKDLEDYNVYIPPPEVILGTEGFIELAISTEGPITQMLLGHTIFGSRGYPLFIDDDPEGLDPDFTVDEELVSEESDIEEEQVQPVFIGPGPAPPVTVPQASPGPCRPVPNLMSIQYKPQAPVYSLEEAIVSSQKNIAYDNLSLPRLRSAPTPESSFKREVIERAVRRQETRDASFDASLDPMIRFIIHYDKSRDKLSFQNVEIKVDPYTKTLRCSLCGFGRRESKRGGGSLDLEWKMKAHIMSTHVGYSCLATDCDASTFQTHNHLIKHIREVHPNQLIIKNVRTTVAARRPPPPPPRQPVKPPNNRLTPIPAVPPPVTRQQLRPPPSSHPPRQPPKRRSPPPPPPPPRPSLVRKSPPPAKSFASSNVRVCPVSACRKTFVQKEDFIRHLQAHRNQTKRHHAPPINGGAKRPSNSNSEPEIVTLD